MKALLLLTMFATVVTAAHAMPVLSSALSCSRAFAGRQIDSVREAEVAQLFPELPPALLGLFNWSPAPNAHYFIEAVGSPKDPALDKHIKIQLMRAADNSAPLYAYLWIKGRSKAEQDELMRVLKHWRDLGFNFMATNPSQSTGATEAGDVRLVFDANWLSKTPVQNFLVPMIETLIGTKALPALQLPLQPKQINHQD